MRTSKHFAAVIFILLAFDATYACSCVNPRPPCAYYGNTSAIFLGRVVGSAERKSYLDKDGNKTVYDVGTIRFLVQENFVGAPGYEVEIHSGTGGGDCGYWFRRNESYIVYAYRSQEDNKLYTSICTRTKHVSQAEEDLAFLRGLANAKPGATLYGELERLEGSAENGRVKVAPPMAGVKVVITGEGKTVETITDDKGQYRIGGLAAGEYDAFPELPENLGFVSTHDKRDNFGRFTSRERVRLTDGGCAESSFIVKFNGTVSGRVFDAAGEPAKEAQINLLWGDRVDEYESTWTDKEGYYKFVMVQPGSYLLGFNLTWAPDKDHPYPKTFYPGVKTRAEASLLTVGEGEQLKGYDMTLPPRLHERHLKVTVVWPDGKPAAGVDVAFEVNEATDNGQRVESDAQGTALLSLFENHYYIIYAQAERGEKQFYSRPIEVLVDQDLKPLKLVLSKEGYGYRDGDALKRKAPQ
jgi:hypothetical protein